METLEFDLSRPWLRLATYSGWEPLGLYTSFLGMGDPRTWDEFTGTYFPAELDPTPSVFSSPDVWKVYREPLDAFITFSRRFLQAAVALTEIRVDTLFSGPPGDVSSPEGAVSYLRTVAQEQASFPVSVQRRSVAMRLTSASLFSHLALMLLFDSQSNRRLAQCKTCNRVFASDDPRALYCSPRCRNTSVVRAYRKRMRSKRTDAP